PPAEPPTLSAWLVAALVAGLPLVALEPVRCPVVPVVARVPARAALITRLAFIALLSGRLTRKHGTREREAAEHRHHERGSLPFHRNPPSQSVSPAAFTLFPRAREVKADRGCPRR